MVAGDTLNSKAASFENDKIKAFIFGAFIMYFKLTVEKLLAPNFFKIFL